ncbi:T6SS immunity protein Tdi1 domain-containing protein [Nocardia flavorosea]|uniref:T6SS immunity protein Tdi1 domain-containing protein n=1 Tax=Nocardia flavorosea TaxID=53429 RepID=UPI003CC7FDD0
MVVRDAGECRPAAHPGTQVHRADRPGDGLGELPIGEIVERGPRQHLLSLPRPSAPPWTGQPMLIPAQHLCDSMFQLSSGRANRPVSRGGNGDDGSPLFDRVVDQLGPVGPDTLHAFVPVPVLGGPMLPGHVEFADAEVHMQLSGDLMPRGIMTDPNR